MFSTDAWLRCLQGVAVCFLCCSDAATLERANVKLRRIPKKSVPPVCAKTKRSPPPFFIRIALTSSKLILMRWNPVCRGANACTCAVVNYDDTNQSPRPLHIAGVRTGAFTLMSLRTKKKKKGKGWKTWVPSKLVTGTLRRICILSKHSVYTLLEPSPAGCGSDLLFLRVRGLGSMVGLPCVALKPLVPNSRMRSRKARNDSLLFTSWVLSFSRTSPSN